ncbi:Uncharacterised protein [Vibrio cholerae]|nr:Uncharacterised protein [Vibrio cholerae]
MKQNVSQEAKHTANDTTSNDGRKHAHWVICCEWDSAFRDTDGGVQIAMPTPPISHG